MAVIVVEDGTAKTDANSYISEAELSAYATDRGITVTGTAAVLLIKAMDYLESMDFKGRKRTQEQALQWPRYGVWVDNYYVGEENIPNDLKSALAEIALSIDASVDPLENIDRAVKREKVGDIEVEYMDAALDSVVLSKVSAKLKKLLNNVALKVGRA